MAVTSSLHSRYQKLLPLLSFALQSIDNSHSMVGKLSRRVFLSAARMVARVPHVFLKLLDMLSATSSTHYARMRRRLLAIAEEMDILDAIHLGLEELQAAESGGIAAGGAAAAGVTSAGCGLHYGDGPVVPHNSPNATECNSPSHTVQLNAAGKQRGRSQHQQQQQHQHQHHQQQGGAAAKLSSGAGSAAGTSEDALAERLAGMSAGAHPAEYPKPPVQARSRPQSQGLNSPSSSSAPPQSASAHLPSPSASHVPAFPTDAPSPKTTHRGPPGFAPSKIGAGASPGAQRKYPLQKAPGAGGSCGSGSSSSCAGSSKDPEKDPSAMFTQSRPLPSSQIHRPKPSRPTPSEAGGASGKPALCPPVAKGNMKLDLQQDSILACSGVSGHGANDVSSSPATSAGPAGASTLIPSDDTVFTPVEEKFRGLDASAELNSSMEDLLEATIMPSAGEGTVTFQSEVAVLSPGEQGGTGGDSSGTGSGGSATRGTYTDDVAQHQKCKEKMEAEEEEALAIVMAMSESQDALPIIPQLQVDKGEDVIIIQVDVSYAQQF